MTAWPMCAQLRCAHGTDYTAQPTCDSAHWDCDFDCLTMVKVDLVCCILGKGVPFVSVAMQHGATEDVLLWQKCALSATRMCALCATKVRAVRAVCEHYIRFYNRERTSPLRQDGANI